MKEPLFNDNLPEEVQEFLREKYKEAGVSLDSYEDRINFLSNDIKRAFFLEFFPEKIKDEIKERITLFELERHYLKLNGFLTI